MSKKNLVSRKDFFKGSAAGTLGAITLLNTPLFFTSCSSSSESKNTAIREAIVPEILELAPDGKELTVGLIGCGDRGTGACIDFLQAGNGLSIKVLGDVFPDKIESCKKILKENGQNIEDSNCFVGFDAYQKVIDSDVDIIFLCTPPIFRPEHFSAAVSAGKHIFLEKPCAIDPVGVRAALLSAKQAEQKNLCVISGTIRRSQRDIIETYKRVCDGAIGDIVSAHVVRNGGALWSKKRQAGWSDMEYMLRNWVNFTEISGDLIVEQFIHEIDLMTWFLGKTPVSANGYGGRQRRVSGNQYDHFSINYGYDNGMQANCMSRQISGCSGEWFTMVYGTKGYTNCSDTIFNLDGTVAWKYPHPEEGAADKTWEVKNPFVQEHIRLVTAIRRDEKLNDIEDHVKSALVAIMGRMSAYTGKTVTWDEVMSSTLDLKLDNYAFGPVPSMVEEYPLAGNPSTQI